MRPLTLKCPKPLLDVDGVTLLDRQITKLIHAGVQKIVINAAYLGGMLIEHIGHGEQFGDVEVVVSLEPEPLETAGGIAFAADLLGDAPFLLVNGDVWCDFDYAKLIEDTAELENLARGGGHLVLTDNPAFKAQGDFDVGNGELQSLSAQADGYTYSGVSVLSPALIRAYPSTCRKFGLKEVFDWGLAQGLMSAEIQHGFWLDVGTPERLEGLRQHLKSC